MRAFISLFLLFSISLPTSAGVLPQEHRERLIQVAFANFWGKARLSNGKPVQPDNAVERSTLPISIATANHVVSVGEISGIAEWCGLDWQTHFLDLTTKARRQAFSEKQVAFIGLLHGVVQGNVHSAMQSKPCAADQKARAEKMLKASPVNQAIPR
jgi:hypothetical protein